MKKEKILKVVKEAGLTLYGFYKSKTAKAFNYPNESLVSDGDICTYLRKEKAVENTDFRDSIKNVINMYSKENESDTPDYILAHFIERALKAFDHAVNLRTEWYTPKK